MIPGALPQQNDAFSRKSRYVDNLRAFKRQPTQQRGCAEFIAKFRTNSPLAMTVGDRQEAICPGGGKLFGLPPVGPLGARSYFAHTGTRAPGFIFSKVVGMGGRGFRYDRTGAPKRTNEEKGRRE